MILFYALIDSNTAWLTPPSMLRWWTGNRGGGSGRQGGKESVDLWRTGQRLADDVSMGGGKEISSARERVLSCMVLASAFFCPSEHFFGFDKTPPKPSAFVRQNSQKSAKGTPVRRTFSHS